MAGKGKMDTLELEKAKNRLKNVLAAFERERQSMGNGDNVDQRVLLFSMFCAVFSLLFACLMCYLWTDAAKDRDKYKVFYEYYQKVDKPKSGE